MSWLKRSLLGLLASLGIFIAIFFGEVSRAQTENQAAAQAFFERAQHDTQGHTNNWAVLVCASRYWFNYRHMANALGMYRTVKRLGIPDSNIILMLADDAACNTRNKFPGSVYANPGRQMDLYGDNIEVDYRGYEVTVENFIRLLTVEPSLPRSKRLLTDDRSNIFVYMTGHGGNEFLKFQDNEEISAFDIADAFEQMWQKKRYNEIFFMIDTCQANTMYSKFYSPNILATGSSELGENSYSVCKDCYSFTRHRVLTLVSFANYDPVRIKSHAGVRSDLFNRPLSATKVTDFFGGVAQIEVLDEPIPSLPAFCSAQEQPLSEASSQGRSSDRPSSRDSSSQAHPISANHPSFPSRAKWHSGNTPPANELIGGAGRDGLWAATAIVGGLIMWSRLRTYYLANFHNLVAMSFIELPITLPGRAARISYPLNSSGGQASNLSYCNPGANELRSHHPTREPKQGSLDFAATLPHVPYCVDVHARNLHMFRSRIHFAQAPGGGRSCAWWFIVTYWSKHGIVMDLE
ncbi:ER membrane glycoprotein subunit of the glycosylphosphatidylinositol transamidase complex [Rhizoctonia solani AG-1 IA]|uniref:ER membrane glycoprotein subunit of the glycosylphosphatidylinositol transamidase complex n=1 Tax=Thanatephorus cucumeris (strain AG1-IA) TaxID=983506 RepID=L8WZZ3_THACA|nr:ER membrane glycoprotein subunit of the glycosylphosphatidylinositol transamidase complex [Rhizoctonia solani AG-1 IA]